MSSEGLNLKERENGQPNSVGSLIRVCHLVGSLEIGGAERVLVEFIRNTEGTVFRNYVISIKDVGDLKEEISKAGVPVLGIGKGGTIRAALALPRIREIIKSNNIDVIQTWMYHADLIGGLATNILPMSVKLFWGIHNGKIDKRYLNSRTIIVIRICSVLSRLLPVGVICCSAKSRLEHMLFGYSKDKMVVIANGVDTDKYFFSPSRRDRIRNELGIEDSHIVVGMIARYDEVKRHAVFIDVVSEVSKSIPELRILMCGEGITEDNITLMNRIDKSDIADHCFLLGRRDDIPTMLSALDIVVSTSEYEAFPMIIVEAMAVGRTCVATDAGDTGAIIGEAGFVSGIEDSQGLVKNLKTAINLTPSERERLGKLARQRVEELYSIQKMVAHYKELYSSAIS